MTKVWAQRPTGGERYFSVKGHATGSERVCAAVSGIVYALAGYLANDPAVEMEELRLDDGDVLMSWTGGEKDLAALQMACIGLMQIEKAEPNYIETNISENIFQK